MSEKSVRPSSKSVNYSEAPKPLRVKRSFTAQFKEEALTMLTQQGMSVAEAARRLGVHQNLCESGGTCRKFWGQSLPGSVSTHGYRRGSPAAA